MSDALYGTRLFWNGRGGSAKHDGVTVELRVGPFGQTVAEVDYAPQLRVFQIRESAHGWRDMTPAEISRSQALLEFIAGAARAPLDEA